MIIYLKKEASKKERDDLQKKLLWMGLHSMTKKEEGRHVIAVLKGHDKNVDFAKFSTLPLVERIEPFKEKYKLASRDFKREDTVIEIRGKKIGGKDLTVMAGPCSIESEEQIEQSAAMIKKGGATVLRGGAFKPRTSPYDFQGLGEKGLQILAAAGKKHDLLTISEVMDAEDVELLAKYVDILQVGARNMQNFTLLKKIGKSGVPVLLKRGFSATYQDLLMAAEYIMAHGNPNVILCERGIRTFETFSRNTLDLAAVPILQSLSHLPVVVDPSHGTGIREMVAPMARAAAAAGANGLMIEAHPEPDKSVSDAAQTISLEAFLEIMEDLKIIEEMQERILARQRKAKDL